MTRILGRRLVQSALVLYLLLTLLFIVARLTGDPITMLVGGFTSPADVERLRAAYGLNKPMPDQYVLFLWNALHLDFGDSIRTLQPATGLVLARIVVTMQIAVPALLGSIAIAIPLGALAATRRGPVGYLAMLVAVVGQSVPSFFLGVLLILIFAVWLHWLPVFGQGGPNHLVLPVVTLMGYPLARYTRLVRAQVSETLTQDFVRTARAKGLTERVVIMRHVLRAALLPVVTVIGVDLGLLLGTAVIVEAIFAWPGFGTLLLQAAQTRDYPVIQAAGFMVGVMVLISSIVVDLIYGMLDPRIRVA